MIPKEILDRQTELFELVHKYPINIPAEPLAQFLGKDKDVLRSSIENGSASFGFAGRTAGVHGNRAFGVPTFTFFAWYTKGVTFEEEGNNMTDKEVFTNEIFQQADKLNTAELLLIDIYKQQCDKDGKECDIKGFSEWVGKGILEMKAR